MKIIRISVLVVLCVVLFSGCGTQYEENLWYSDEKLSECLLPSMPIIDQPLLRQDDWKIYTSLTVPEFEDYVKLVYSYLQAQDFKYLGTRGHMKASLAGAFASYYFQPAETLEQHYQNGVYYFIYSDGETDESGQIVFCCLLMQNSYGSGYSLDHKGNKFYYNTAITLRKGSERSAAGRYVYDPENIDPCFFGHLYDNGTDYPVPGTEQTVTIRNCVNCGWEDYEPFTGDMHSYRITVTKGSQYIITLPETHDTYGALPEKRPSGMLMKLYTQRLDDADIVFTVNGTVIPKEETEKGWCYSFIIPNCDVEIAINVIDGYLISE